MARMTLTMLVVPLALAFVGYFVWLQKKRMASALAGSTEYTVGSIAQRLGLNVVEGDSTLNFLYLMQPPGDDTFGEFERRVRMVGAPYGRHTELSFADGVTVAKDALNLLITREAIHHYRAALTMSLNANVAPFELTLRTPNEYLRPRCAITGSPGVREASLGNPTWDAQFRLATLDPRVGPVIAHAVSGLAHHLFVHVHAHDGRLEMYITRMGLPYVAHAAEEYLLALETIACALEGRSAPVRADVTLAGAA